MTLICRNVTVSFATALVGLLTLVGCGGREPVAASRESTSLPLAAPSPTDTTAGRLSTTSAPAPGPSATSPQTSGDLASNDPHSPAPLAGEGPQGDSVEGFTVSYPAGWGPAGRLQATAFANGATCGSAAIVDRAAPGDSGPGASIEQSFVQICWRELDGMSLAEFMAATYGTAGGFEPVTLAGRPAVVSRAGNSSTSFVDTSTRRYQVATAVIASPELTPVRLGEVEHILESLSLPD